MTRLKLTIEYDGTGFSGWQIQPDCRTVQGELEEILKRFSGRHIQVTGSGRTDAGVHALGQTAHIDVEEFELDRVLKGLNSMLPDDVSVNQIDRVGNDFHARFSAVSRTYRYRTGKVRRPLRFRYEHCLRSGDLDIQAISRAVCLCRGIHDWKAMAKEGSDNSNWLVDVLGASAEADESGWTFIITANRFLRGLARIWSGTLIDIGSGRRKPEVFTEMFESGNRSLAGQALPAKGLTLMEVRYD